MSSWSQLVKATKEKATSSSLLEGKAGRAGPHKPVALSDAGGSVRRDPDSSATDELSRQGSAHRKGASKHDEWADVLGKRDKKLPAFLRPSPNVAARSSKHDASPASKRTTSAWASTPSSKLDDVRATLERKARMYDQLQRGKTAGLSEDRLRESLVDWDRKDVEDGDGSEDEESDEGTKATTPPADAASDNDNDPMVEYEDDLGRTRRVRRSEVPREALRAEQRRKEDEFDEALIIRGPATSFPVYEPDPVRRAQARMGESGSSVGGYKRNAPEHFDASAEKRYRGAGFYHFSQDEQIRTQQMDGLRKEREATLRERAAQSDEPDRPGNP